MGRIDFQVKLHGHRIEVGEVEAALSQSPLVSDAVVLLARDATDGDSEGASVREFLVAYIAPVDGMIERSQTTSMESDIWMVSNVLTRILQLHCSLTLEDYKVPAFIFSAGGSAGN